MRILPLDRAYREQVDRIVAREWAGPLIVTRGRAMDASRLPGFVCIGGGRVIGAILYDVRGDDCEIAALVSYAQNKGVGSSLIRAVADAANARGCKRVFLITTNDNAHAIRYWQKRGFSLCAVHIDAVRESRRIKPQIPELGIDDIPILHEFEFELFLNASVQTETYR